VPRPILVFVAAAVLAAPAAAAHIEATPRGGLLVGTPQPDRIVGRAGPDRIQAAFGGIDNVSCGRGLDVVSADREDRVAADCEIVARRLSHDTSTSTRAQHETAVEPDDFAWGSTVVATYQVGRWQTGASSLIGWATSFDAGRTWRAGTLPSLTAESSPSGEAQRASDPAVAYDAVHGVWLISSLALSADGLSRILISRSTDALHWTAPIEVNVADELDKEWVACDNGAASPNRGRCYVMFHNLDERRSVSQSSTDGGQTWAPEVRVGDDDLVGLQPVVRPDGSLVVVSGSFPDRGPGSIVVVRSTDGGVTFGAPSTIAVVQQHDTAGLRALPLPSADVDASGRVYAAWHDCRFRTGCNANDIVLATSSDGVAWSPPGRIPIDGTGSGIDHFITGLGAAPNASGRIGVVYAFRPGSTGGIGIGFTSSRDGGAHWTKAQPLDAQPMAPDWLADAINGNELGRMLGDYFSVAFAGGRWVPVFALAAHPLSGRFREAIFASSLLR
jgi:hypothetical protein